MENLLTAAKATLDYLVSTSTKGHAPDVVERLHNAIKQEEWEGTQPKQTTKIHVLIQDINNSGIQVEAHATHEGAHASLAKYVRDNWNVRERTMGDFGEWPPMAPPEDDAESIEFYFEYNSEKESWDIQEVALIGEPEPKTYRLVTDPNSDQVFVEVWDPETVCEHCASKDENAPKGAWVLDQDPGGVGLCDKHVRECYDAVIEVDGRFKVLQELYGKYGDHWGNDDKYTPQMWADEVAEMSTRLGYKEWVYNKKRMEEK